MENEDSSAMVMNTCKGYIFCLVFVFAFLHYNMIYNHVIIQKLGKYSLTSTRPGSHPRTLSVLLSYWPLAPFLYPTCMISCSFISLSHSACLSCEVHHFTFCCIPSPIFHQSSMHFGPHSANTYGA